MTDQYLLIFVLFLMLFFVFSREYMESDNTSREEQEKKLHIGTYAKSMRDGMIRGGLSSLIFGGYEGMIGNIVSHGLVNSIMKYVE